MVDNKEELSQEETLNKFNQENNIFLSSEKTSISLSLLKDIEIHQQIKESNLIIKVKDIILYAPKFKHRAFCGKIKDNANRQNAVIEGMAEFDNNFISNNYETFYEFFKSTDDILKIKYEGEALILKDKSFIDEISMDDIEKIIAGYLNNFFH